MLFPLLTVFVLASSCPVSFPVPEPAPVVRSFAPAGPFAGHWGVDLAVPPGTPVRSVARGVVTFAGSVAGTRSVTVDHGGGLRTTYSYLGSISVSPGSVVAGGVLGGSGEDHGVAALHVSVRFGSRYVDPLRVLGCRIGPPGDALGLAS
jgi:murein DD-endopeptidase MepM/ murein hydrolase activator NlpD